jgi:hypothetical protein
VDLKPVRVRERPLSQSSVVRYYRYSVVEERNLY